jgi:HSP20 family protein
MFSLVPRWRERKAEGAIAPREYDPFEMFRRGFTSLFDRTFPAWSMGFERPWETFEPWGLEVEEKEEEVVVRAELPGFEAKDLEINLRGNVLYIRAEHHEATEGEEAERRHAKLKRSVTLPMGIVPDKVEATYRNGVLEVHVPFTPEAKPRRIAVKA